MAGGCTNNYPDLTFSIFDRYGRVIAKQTGTEMENQQRGITPDYYTLKLNNKR
jgi:hypothetical protein